MIDDESLVKTRTNIFLSDAYAVPSYSVTVVQKSYFLATNRGVKTIFKLKTLPKHLCFKNCTNGFRTAHFV